MSTFSACAALLPSPPGDPGRRVNYTHGMVLGVDEFTQQFAYLAGRGEWLARELLGYGTVAGLRVHAMDDGEHGPRIVVSAGAALSQSGRPVRVAAAQQAYVNQWLEAHREEVALRAELELGSPPGGSIGLYLVLCYRERLTGLNPGPGEPCRTEDVPPIPSRVADDFVLDLRFDPPALGEEREVRRFLELLSQVEFTEVGGALPDEFLDALRMGLGSVTDEGEPELLGGSPPGRIRIPRDQSCEYLRAALRLWVTELRPLARVPLPDPTACPSSTSASDCVFLATIRIPLAFTQDAWRVDDAADIVIDEEHRPVVGHARLLQEWLLCGRGGAGHHGGAPAAGRVRGTTILSARGGLRVTAMAAGSVKLAFDDYHQPGTDHDYVVKALASRPAAAAGPIVVEFGGFEVDGFVLRVTTAAGAALAASDLADLELQVEVSRL